MRNAFKAVKCHLGGNCLSKTKNSLKKKKESATMEMFLPRFIFKLCHIESNGNER